MPFRLPKITTPAPSPPPVKPPAPPAPPPKVKPPTPPVPPPPVKPPTPAAPRPPVKTPEPAARQAPPPGPAPPKDRNAPVKPPANPTKPPKDDKKNHQDPKDSKQDAKDRKDRREEPKDPREAPADPTDQSQGPQAPGASDRQISAHKLDGPATVLEAFGSTLPPFPVEEISQDVSLPGDGDDAGPGARDVPLCWTQWTDSASQAFRVQVEPPSKDASGQAGKDRAKSRGQMHTTTPIAQAGRTNKTALLKPGAKADGSRAKPRSPSRGPRGQDPKSKDPGSQENEAPPDRKDAKSSEGDNFFAVGHDLLKDLKSLSDPMPLIGNSYEIKSLGDAFYASSVYFLYCVNEMLDHWFQDVWQEGEGFAAKIVFHVEVVDTTRFQVSWDIVRDDTAAGAATQASKTPDHENGTQKPALAAGPSPRNRSAPGGRKGVVRGKPTGPRNKPQRPLTPAQQQRATASNGRTPASTQPPGTASHAKTTLPFDRFRIAVLQVMAPGAVVKEEIDQAQSPTSTGTASLFQGRSRAIMQQLAEAAAGSDPRPLAGVFDWKAMFLVAFDASEGGGGDPGSAVRGEWYDEAAGEARFCMALFGALTKAVDAVMDHPNPKAGESGEPLSKEGATDGQPAEEGEPVDEGVPPEDREAPVDEEAQGDEEVPVEGEEGPPEGEEGPQDEEVADGEEIPADEEPAEGEEPVEGQEAT